MVEQLLPFLSEIGFPAIIAFYLLHRIETKLDAMIQSVQSLGKLLYEMRR